MTKDLAVKIEDKDIKILHGKICLSSRAIYLTLKIDESTLVKWGQKGCPKMARGWWVLQDVLAWRGIVDSEEAVNPNDIVIDEQSIDYQKKYYETALKKIQIEAADLKNAIARGDYIPKGEIVEELKRVFVVLKKSLKGFSRKVASEISYRYGADEARQAERFVSDLTNNALEQLCIDGVYHTRRAS